MKDHSGCKRQFIHFSRAWYSSVYFQRDFLDEITIGFYHKDGGTTGEFSIEWIGIDGKRVPKLCSYEDSWDALFHFKDVLEKMAGLDNKNSTPDQICSLLISCGVEDVTPTKSPYKE